MICQAFWRHKLWLANLGQPAMKKSNGITTIWFNYNLGIRDTQGTMENCDSPWFLRWPYFSGALLCTE